MKKMINFIKNNIFGFLLGLLLCLNGVVIAENIITANQVTYNDSTVQAELDSLFNVVDINEEIDVMKEQISLLQSSFNDKTTVNEIYPIGSIYISTSKTNPSTLFKGTTWEIYGENRMLMGVGTSSNSGQTGGSNTATLTTNNLPSHSHSYTPSGSVTSTFTGSSSTTNQVDLNHTHSVSGNTGNQSANHTHSIPSLSGTTSSEYIKLRETNAYTGQNPGYTSLNNNSTWSDTRGNESGYLDTIHSHNITTKASTTGSNSSNHTHSISITSGYMSANNKHSHTVTPLGSVSSTFTGAKTSTENTGSGTVFSVQNPYITVYMWKRIA